MMRACDTRGFSLIEALVAVGIFMAAAGVLFHFASASQRLARAQPDAADVNQRVRVAAGRDGPTPRAGCHRVARGARRRASGARRR